MAITQALCTSFKVDLLNGLHAFGTSVVRAGTGADSFKVALYTNTATLDASTTQYTTASEVANGNGYTTGGGAITITQAPTSTTTIAWLDFQDTTWGSTATFTARGGLIYNDTNASDKSVAVLDFGTDKQVDNGTFTIQWPVGDSSTGIIRIV